MKNNTNIYDIDGEIIRPAGDNHHFTIDEAKEKIQIYQAKIKELTEKEDKTEEDLKKLAIYQDYCKNLMNYEWAELMKMNKNDFTNYLKDNMNSGVGETSVETVEKALNEVKNDIEAGENTENEVSGPAPNDNESTGNEESGDDEAIERPIGDIHEERPTTQDSLLVERDGVVNNMDEYVSPIGEASDEYVEYKEV